MTGPRRAVSVLLCLFTMVSASAAQSASEPAITLSTEEQAWLAKNHTVRVRIGDYPPTYFVKDGKPLGVAVDLLEEIAIRAGVKFSFIIPSPPFSEDYNGLIQQSGPDLLPSLQATPEREKHILFTDAYYTDPRFIFTRDDSPFVSSIKDLAGKSVAVEGGFLVQNWLESKYPEVKLLSVVNTKEALQAVSLGKAFAYIGPIRPTATMINRYGFNNIKAAAPSSLPDGVAQMGIRRDWPELRSIINKTLASIPADEKTAIINKWTPITFEYGIQPGDVFKWILAVALVLTGVIFLFVFWNRSLAMKVRQRTAELERTADSLKTEIAEKIRAESALQKSRRYTDKLIETANVMIVGLDAKGDVNVFNPAAERITGYSFSELREKNWFEMLVPKNRYPQVHAEFSRLMAGGLPKLFENPILTKNGDERVISWCNNEIIDGDQITGILSFGIDITEKKQAEDALAESEARFRSLMEQSPISMQIHSPDGKLVQSNAAYKRLYGFNDETLVSFYDKYNILEDPQAEEKGFMPFIESVFAGEENVVFPIIEYDPLETLKNLGIKDFQAKRRWIQARGFPLKDKHGNVLYAVFSAEDITRSLQAAEALRMSEERFRALMEQAPFSIVVNTPDGRIVQVNQAFMDLWGISEEALPEVLEKYNILEDDEARRRGVMPLIEKAFRGEAVSLPVIEYDVSGTMGEMGFDGVESIKRWLQVRFYPIKRDTGGLMYVVAVEEDITERKKAEEKIQEYQQRLKALATQLMIAEEQERRRIAADIHDHVGHSLALARIQLDGIMRTDSDLERAVLVKDISNIILEALQETRSLIFELSSPLMHEIGLGAATAEWLEERIEKRHGLNTEFSDTIEKKHRDTLDENARALLFRNVRELLTNVIKHAHANNVTVRLQQQGNDIQIIIEDDGIGFDHDTLKERSSSKKGFGLFSIQERMTDLGGTLDIHSAPGKGCRVVLTVPIQ